MKPKHGGKRHSVTDIVAAVYCEQKSVFDREHGKVESNDLRAKREDGIGRHKTFERAAVRVDKRCFIATAVYGEHALETNFLRDWRDRVLMPSIPGRALVHLYYFASPRLLPALERHACLARVTRRSLDRLVRLLEARRW